MKKIKIAKYVAASLLLMTAPTSCSDYLDKEPDTELDLSMVFTHRDKVYQLIPTPLSTILTSIAL